MFKTLTDDAILPKRQTRFSAGFDVFANEDKVISAGQTELVELGIAIDIDSFWDYFKKEAIWDIGNQEKRAKQYKDNFMRRHYFALHIRSSLRAKGLTSLGTGIIDIDYPDEIKMLVHHTMPRFTQSFQGSISTDIFRKYKINKGDKIGQLILLQHAGHLMPDEYTLDNERVGGFGSSGAR